MTIKQLEQLVRNIVQNSTSSKISQSDLPYKEILNKFPEVSTTLEKLMTSQYDSFLKNIEWVSPRPTTFKLTLNNGNIYYLIWNNGDFTAEIAGKRYDLSSIASAERAVKSLNSLIITGPINPSKDELAPPPEEGGDETSGE